MQQTHTPPTVYHALVSQMNVKGKNEVWKGHLVRYWNRSEVKAIAIIGSLVSAKEVVQKDMMGQFAKGPSRDLSVNKANIEIVV